MADGWGFFPQHMVAAVAQQALVCVSSPACQPVVCFGRLTSTGQKQRAKSTFKQHTRTYLVHCLLTQHASPKQAAVRADSHLLHSSQRHCWIHTRGLDPLQPVYQLPTRPATQALRQRHGCVVVSVQGCVVVAGWAGEEGLLASSSNCYTCAQQQLCW